MQSCLALRFLVKRKTDGARGMLMNIYFHSNIGPSLACMRTSRKTSARLKITFVDTKYPKGWTGSPPLCPPIFFCCFAPMAKLPQAYLVNLFSALLLVLVCLPATSSSYSNGHVLLVQLYVFPWFQITYHSSRYLPRKTKKVFCCDIFFKRPAAIFTVRSRSLEPSMILILIYHPLLRIPGS